MITDLDRGDVVVVRLRPSQGHSYRTTRAAVVLSNAAACRLDAVIQVVPLTALPQRPLRPFESRVASPSSGLTNPSRAAANQLRSIARDRVLQRVGHVERDELADLDRAVSIQLGLRREP